MNVTLPLIIIADSHDGNIAYYSELIQALGARAVGPDVEIGRVPGRWRRNMAVIS